MLVDLTLFMVVVAILCSALYDLVKENRQISKMIAALLLITFGAVFLLFSMKLGLDVMFVVAEVNGKEVVGVYAEEFTKLISAVGIGTAGMAIITGGFSLIASGKYEVSISSTEPIRGIEVKK
jgi:uncharacterized membrane protein YwaF